MALPLRPVLLALASAALALAGCAEKGGEDAGGAGTGGAADADADGLAAASIAAPTPWAVGDAWTYSFNGVDSTYVVTQDAGADWIVETDSEERAFSNQREDISRLGPQRKSDLAGSQGAERLEFFRWPLEAGRTWSTRWDGVDVDVRVLEGGTAEVQTLEATATGDGARADGGPLYRYTYDAGAGWFGELHRFGPDGSEMVTLTLTKAVHGWTGTIVRWSLETVIEDAGNDPMAPPFVMGPFEVASGATDIWAEYHFACGGNGGYAVTIEPVNPGLAGQQGTAANGQCTQVDFAGVVQDGPHPGTWTMAVSAGGQTIDYQFAILVRTRQDVPFPA